MTTTTTVGNAMEPTCETSGHSWVNLVGGRRCERCGDQIAARDDWARNGYFCSSPDLLAETFKRLADGDQKPVLMLPEEYEWYRRNIKPLS